jgi:hypothetical protein
MALTDIERVRRKIADKLQLRRERFDADGVSDHFKMKFEPISQLPAPEIWINGAQQTEGTDYSVDYEFGIVVFANAPTVNQKLIFQYYASVWTDEEIQDFLDQYSSNLNITSAHMLFAWAADAAKLAKRETLSGGGGVGAVTRDTSVAARELRNTAKALMDWEVEYGESLGTQVPADGLTEIPWTEAAHYATNEQRIIRDS